jgi:hypothetical protein
VCGHDPDLAYVTPESQPSPPSIRSKQQRAGHRVRHVVVGPAVPVKKVIRAGKAFVSAPRTSAPEPTRMPTPGAAPDDSIDA